MKKGVEVSYLEIAGTAGLALTYHMLKGESLPELAFNTAVLGGTLLFSKAAYQGAKSLRELVVGPDAANTSSSEPNSRKMLRQ